MKRVTAVLLSLSLAIACSRNNGAHWWETPSTPSATPPPVPTTLNVVFNPPALYGGQAAIGTLTMLPASAVSAASVTLSSNQDAIAVPSTVTIPAGATSTTFSVTTRTVAADLTGTVSASLGAAVATAPLTLFGVRANSFHWFAEPGGPVGRDWDRLPPNTLYRAHCERNELQLIATALDGSDRSAQLFLAAPNGTPLRTGTYQNANNRRGAFPDGLPGMTLSVDGINCDVRSGGLFVVSESDLTPTGGVRRFVADFEARCGLTGKAMTGEVRLTGPFPGLESGYTCLR